MRRLPPLRWLLLIASVIWLVMIMPPVTLLAWLLQKNAAIWISSSVLLTPIVLAWSWSTVTSKHTQRARWLTMQYMGLCAVLLPILGPAWLLTLIVGTYNAGLITTIVWLIVAMTGVRAATRVTEQQLSITHEKVDKNYRLVQISDVHVGSRSTAFLSGVVNQVMSHQPDVVVITGDLLDLHHVDAEYLAPLSMLTCPVCLCLGNHECYVDLAKAIDAIESSGVRVLRNGSMTLGSLQIHGIDDQNDANQVTGILQDMVQHDHLYQILLYHRPDGWASALQNGIDLTLAGHTHAGQIWPFRYLVARQFKQVAGHFEHAGQHLYVSSGTGTWGPVMRLGTRCEMTIVELSPN